MRTIVGGWIMSYYTTKYEIKWKVLDAKYAEREKIIKAVDGRRALWEKVQTAKGQIRQEELAPICQWSHLKSVDQLELKHYVEYFRKITMPELMEAIWESDPDCSLLPQDILDKLIHHYLCGEIFDSYIN
jgi:hypothetical protein